MNFTQALIEMGKGHIVISNHMKYKMEDDKLVFKYAEDDSWAPSSRSFNSLKRYEFELVKEPITDLHKFTSTEGEAIFKGERVTRNLVGDWYLGDRRLSSIYLDVVIFDLNNWERI